MNRTPVRPFLLASMLLSAPWLFGAEGDGCGATRTPYPPTHDAGNDAGAAACVSDVGGPCGGNVRTPCECRTGLMCSPNASDPKPSGDVGGVCLKPSSPAAGSGGAAPSPNDAGTSQQPSDAGTCVAKRGEHCGGNIRNACTCDKGLECQAQAGSKLPVGDVGGTCEPPVSVDNDGGVCLSVKGGPCGGNLRGACACANGLVCTAKPGSNLPVGDVGGTCEDQVKPHACQRVEDCELQADYCTGCDCVALAHGESIPACSGPGVRCLVDPCGTKKADCVSGFCVAK